MRGTDARARLFNAHECARPELVAISHERGQGSGSLIARGKPHIPSDAGMRTMASSPKSLSIVTNTAPFAAA